jgi:outer membrane protein assembly factor BamB
MQLIRAPHHTGSTQLFVMRKNFILASSLLLCLGALTAWNILHPTPAPKPATIRPVNLDDSGQYERDILSEILALNSGEKYKPKKDFRKGHVTVSTTQTHFEKTPDGFSIQLGSNTNIPTPAVINGHVYTSGGFGSKQYFSFDAQTGKTDWAIDLDDDGPSSPAVEDGIIVFNTESCTIFACDLLTGKQVWSYWLGDPLMSMPTIANGIVYTSYPAHYEGAAVQTKRDTADKQLSLFPTHVLIAFDLKTGDILWQRWIDSDIMSAPVAKDDLLYITTFSGALYKIKQRTGDILEAKAIRATSAPVFDGNNELIVSRRSDSFGDSVASEMMVRGMGRNRQAIYNKRSYYIDNRVQEKSKLKAEALKMDAGNGFSAGAPATSNWKAAYDNIGQSNVASLQSFQGSRAIWHRGNLYNTMGDEIICTDSAGKVKWKYGLDGDLKQQGGFLGTPPVYANGYLLVATLNGEILIIDAKDGKVNKKYTIKEAVRYQPVADKGWVYVTTVNSKLYAINTGNPGITGWAMWGGNAARTNMAVEK